MWYVRSLTLATLFAAFTFGADLESIKTVYLLPMSRGLDQYLAQRLAAGSRFQVVTDPMKADAFFVDRIGSNFEERLTELLVPKSAVEKQDDPSSYTFYKPAMQPLSQGKGNVFLVDRQAHAVIWSAFVTAKGTGAKDLSRVASELADRLNKIQKAK